MRTKCSNPALKNAWRFIGLVYILILGFFVIGATARYWMPASNAFGGGILFVTIMVLALVVAFAFALAAIGWAAWSLYARTGKDTSASVVAIAAAVVTTAMLGGYLLILTGIVRLK